MVTARVTLLDLPTNIFNKPIHRPLTFGSLHTDLDLTTCLLLPALTSHWPANRLLTISSLLTPLRLITFLVLHLLTSNPPLNRPLSISSPLTGLSLITLDMIPAPHLYKASTQQKLIWMQELTTGHYEDGELS